MSLPLNTEDILRFLTGVETGTYSGAWELITPSGLVTISVWDNVIAGRTQPTEQEVIDAGNDLTTVNGQLFSAWIAEHGGDVIATLRRQAKEALDTQQQEINALIRALALVIMDEINILRADNNIGLPARTASQLRTAIKAKIDAGDADT